MGYQRNAYYWCLTNRIFKGKQYTILRHVNRLKMSHVDSEIVSRVLADIESAYGKISKPTTTRGKFRK